jgi:hypothetical protein
MTPVQLHKGRTMSKNFADDTDVSSLMSSHPNEREDIPEELNETPTPDEAPAEEAVEGDAADEQVSDELEAGTVVKTDSPIGPSPAMLEVAKQWLPSQFISTARDDQQLQDWIEVVREQKSEPAQGEPEPEFELTLPEDEFGDSDAVRKQFKALNDHNKKVNSGLKKDLGDAISAINNLQKGHDENVQFRQQQEQRQFDGALDAMDSDYFGKEGNVSQEQFLLREAVYKAASADKSGKSLSELAQPMAKKLLPGLQDRQTKQTYKKRIIEQSNGRLGYGNSKRLPEPEQSRESRFDDFLQKVSTRHK